jgi:hypothetical protein
MIGDKSYDNKANRKAIHRYGVIPLIPHKSNEKNQPVRLARIFFTGHARV